MESTFLTQFIMPLCLFVIMFGMGLSLQPKDFSRVFIYPKAILLGLFGQLFVLPAFGFFVAYFMLDEPLLAMGVMLIAACPGGTTSNMVTHLAKGDTALSVSLTAFSSIVTLVSIPLILALSAEVFTSGGSPFQLPVKRMMLTLFVITLLPISIGMLVRHYAETFATNVEPKINVFSAVFLVVLIASLCYQQRETLGHSIIVSGPATALMNIVTILIGLAMARVFQLNRAQSTSVMIEIGIQNGALAMLIATTVLAIPEMAIPAAVYSLFMYITGGLVIAGSHHLIRKGGTDNRQVNA